MEWISTLLAGVEFWHWLVLGLVLFGAELATGTSQLLWPAFAAWITGVVALLLPIGVPAQILVFAVAVLLLVGVAKPLLAPLLRRHRLSLPDVNDPTARLIGSPAEAVSAFPGGRGRVRIGDGEWNARGPADLTVGTSLIVTGVEGTTVEVRRP